MRLVAAMFAIAIFVCIFTLKLICLCPFLSLAGLLVCILNIYVLSVYVIKFTFDQLHGAVQAVGRGCGDVGCRNAGSLIAMCC